MPTMKMLWGVLVVTLLCLPGTGHALRANKALHHYVRGSWSIQDGLPQVSVLAMAQDRDGYLWIGTQSGLARFDGVRFTRFTPESEPGLPGMWMRSLHLAGDGRLWVGTYKGAAVREGAHFKQVDAVDIARWPTLEINAFAEDAGGVLWVATAQGLFRADGDRLHAVPGSPAPALSLLPQAGGLLVGGRGAVHLLAEGRWEPQPLPPSAQSASVARLVQTQGQLWAGTSLGLYERGQGAWRASDAAPRLGALPVELLYADRDGDLWAGGDAGIARLRQAKTIDFVAPSDPGAVPGVRSALHDREGNLWFGSQSEGLVRLRDSWTRRYSTPEGLHAPIVWSLSPDPDGRRIWVGSDQGVAVFDGRRFRQVAEGGALPHPNAYSMLAEAGQVWIGTRRGLVLIEHEGPIAGRVQRPERFAALQTAQVNGLARTPDGDLWICTSEGLYRERGGQLQHYAQEAGLADPRVRYFHLGSDGSVLVGTQGGLFKMRGERFEAAGLAEGLPAGLDVTSIASLADGRTVIGTLNEQTWFLHRGRWHALDAEDGLPGNAAFFLVEHRGYLWGGGLRGITQVPIADLAEFAGGGIARVRGEMLLNERGDSRSGQQGLCCNGAGNSKGFLRGDALWFPSRDGLVALETDAIGRNEVPPGVAIERVKVGEQWRGSDEIEQVQLPASARDLSFEFTVLSLQDPASVGIQYRLQGYDRQWREASPLQRSASYTNLPPGPYEFQLRGTNNAGVPSLGAAALAFSIQPRFHESRMFSVLVVVLLLGSLYGLYRLLQRRHQRQREALEALVRERTGDLEIANRGLQEASDTDPLTGLRNRRYMTSQLPADLAYYDRRAREGQHVGDVMAFALLDIDYFKRVNDGHGHLAGDRVLVQIADVLRALVRSGDYVVRWGGEEFLVVFRPMSEDQTVPVAQRLCQSIAGHVFELDGGRTLRVTCSVGLAEYPLSTQQTLPVDWNSMIELADRALYHAKQNGRNAWVAFCPLDRSDVDTLLRQLRTDPAAVFHRDNPRVVGSVAGLRSHPLQPDAAD